MTTLAIRGGRIIDPTRGIDAIGDLHVRGGSIVDSLDGSTPDEVIDATGLIVSPGFVDIHVRLGEPGHEEDETIATGTAAAVAGGFTSIAALPDNDPVTDNRAAAEFITLQAQRAGNCHVFPLGAVTKGCRGEELAEIGQLVEGGAVGFSEGKQPIANAEVMRRALQYAGMFNRPIVHHPQVPDLVAGAVMHEGFTSTVLGLRGMPAAAEEIMVRRDIALAEATGGHVHLMSVSSRQSVDEIRQARQRGVKVTADVAPHHLLLTDEALKSFDSNMKVDPPLRTVADQEALIEGLVDGTIDAISSDHQPCAGEKKDIEIDIAPFGIAGLETVLPLCVTALVEPGHLDWPGLLRKLTCGPAKVLNLARGTLAPSSVADVTLIDPQQQWTINARTFASKASNTPFDGCHVTGRVVTTIVAGNVVHRLRNDES